MPFELNNFCLPNPNNSSPKPTGYPECCEVCFFPFSIWHVSRNVKYRGRVLSPRPAWNACQVHQCMPTCARFCTGPDAGLEVMQPRSWSPPSSQGNSVHACEMEGMSLSGRLWEHGNGHSCFPHSVCRIFSFLVYSAINFLVVGPLFWA